MAIVEPQINTRKFIVAPFYRKNSREAPKKRRAERRITCNLSPIQDSRFRVIILNGHHEALIVHECSLSYHMYKQKARQLRFVMLQAS